MLKIEINDWRAESSCDGKAETVITEAMVAIRSMYDLIKGRYGDVCGDYFAKLLRRTQDTVLFSNKYAGVELDPDTTEDDLPFA